MGRKSAFMQSMTNGLGIIQGWKAIGRHLGRSGRTARRWYDNYHLPVRRAITGRPFALQFELDSWMVHLSDTLEKNYKDEREELREHAAMMRSCKKKNGKK